MPEVGGGASGRGKGQAKGCSWLNRLGKSRVTCDECSLKWARLRRGQCAVYVNSVVAIRHQTGRRQQAVQEKMTKTCNSVT